MLTVQERCRVPLVPLRRNVRLLLLLHLHGLRLRGLRPSPHLLSLLFPEHGATVLPSDSVHQFERTVLETRHHRSVVLV